MNRLRKKSFSEVTLNEEVTSIISEFSVPEVEKNERYVLFRSKFLLLSEDCQKVLNLFLTKVKMVEIVKIMGYGSVNYAKKKKFKCKERLTKLVINDAAYKELIN